jgi:ABC-type Fe3+-hydroxamate transport system substrate-binding protein
MSLPLLDALGVEHQPFRGEPRIVSLVPSLTELVCDLGLTARLVGRTGFCVHPREALRTIAKVGGTKDVNIDKVRELAPTHLIADIDENTREQVTAMMAFVPHVIVVNPRKLDDNIALYQLLGGVFSVDTKADELIKQFHQRRAEMKAATALLPREKVLYPIWREPWMTISRDTYISDMLAAAEWDTLPTESQVRFPEFDWRAESVTAAQRILLPSEPFVFTERHVDEIAIFSTAPVTRIDGEMVSWYGSRAILAMTYLTQLRLQTSRQP